MKINTVIFDLDGTLLYTLEDLTDSTNYALKFFNYPAKTIEEVKNFIGNGVAKLIERAIPNGLENKNYKKCLEIFKEHYAKNMYNKTTPYEGVLELLRDLKNENYKIAVVSNKFDNAVKDLCYKYFPNLINFCAGENEAEGIKKKPAPDTVLKIIKNFNISKNEAIYIGDSEVDIQTAQNAGLKCISVCWGYKNRDFLIKNGADILAQKPSDIKKYL